MTLFFLDEFKEKNKYKMLINKILNKVEEKQDDKKVFLKVAINEKSSSKKIKKVLKKIEKYQIKTIILSNKLYEVKQLKNELYAKNINILDGKYLFKLLTNESLNYICKNSKTKIERIEVSILTNDANDINKQIILELAEKVKNLNIITNHINKFKSIEEYLYNEKGIIINLSNNYKVALQKTNIIINIDFPEEIINKYTFPINCIFLNMGSKIKIKSKKFNGININNYNIIIPRQYKIEGFNNNFVYEGYLMDKEYKKAKKHIEEDKIIIKNLIGEKGIINNKEFLFFP